jgi:hypothetical protein
MVAIVSPVISAEPFYACQLTRIQSQLPQQHHPRKPIPSLTISIQLHRPAMSPHHRLCISQTSSTANIRRRLQLRPRPLRFRRLLLRPIRRRRPDQGPSQQRMEARPLHQSPSNRRPRRLRKCQAPTEPKPNPTQNKGTPTNIPIRKATTTATKASQPPPKPKQTCRPCSPLRRSLSLTDSTSSTR